MQTFREYAAEQDDRMVRSNTIQPGEMQRDPDKPSDQIDSDLVNTLKDIIQMAQRAIEMREKGLADLKGGQDDRSQNNNNVVVQSKTDGPEDLFGQD